MKKLGVIVLMGLAALLATGCGGGQNLPSNDRLVSAFLNGTTGLWVSGHGRVVRPLGSSSDTQRFLVQVSDELSLVVRHQIGDLGPVPADSDDVIAFQGRYEFHGGGGELILTHAEPSNPGGGGWIEFDGTRYE
jgi:hypothetical protein